VLWDNSDLFYFLNIKESIIKDNLKLATIGREIFPGYELQIWYNPDENFKPEFNTGTRFRLVFVESGTGILHIGGRDIMFIAPVLFYLNEKDRPALKQKLNMRARALYFHPNVINGAFTFENVRSTNPNLPTATDFQDLYWLQPFLKRTSEYSGEVQIGPTSAQRLLHLFYSINMELKLQKDNNWPCRSRSFFLELIYLAEQLFSSPQDTEKSTIAGVSEDIAAIIMYLYTHYYERITLNQLTRTFHVNRTTLTEQFNKATGMSVIAYLIQLRIHMAALMLKDTGLSINEILNRVGFKDHVHFGRMFRKHLGYSPSEYRKHYCWMLE